MTNPLEKYRQRAPMVNWYDPLELAKTGWRTLVSSTLGTQIDTRLLNLRGDDEDSVFTEYASQTSATFDYAADTGDGYDATYSLAWQLSAPQLPIALPNGDITHSVRADFTILGGDEVYPTPSARMYAQRLVSPFMAAADAHDYNAADEISSSWLKEDLDPLKQNQRDIFLIPGNHDWYDSLSSFNTRFTFQRSVGMFKTRQPRSYFIVTLPHGWEIWGADVQLNGRIDEQQFRFFRRRTEHWQDEADIERKVILCLATPPTADGRRIMDASQVSSPFTLLSRLVENKKAEAPVVIGGDVHNYQRYHVKPLSTNNPEREHLHLVSGGGGAFLHPTHRPDRHDKQSDGIQLAKEYPDRSTSWKLSTRLCRFAFKHWKMSLAIGLLAATLLQPLAKFIAQLPVLSASAALAAGLIVSIASLSHKALATRWALFLQIPHILGQLWLVYWGTLKAKQLSTSVLEPLRGHIPNELQLVAELLLPFVVTVGICGLACASLFGFYLFISLNFFRLHRNEAFSALEIDDYKHFLRINIDAQGRLNVAAIAADKVEQAGTAPMPKLVDSFQWHNGKITTHKTTE